MDLDYVRSDVTEIWGVCHWLRVLYFIEMGVDDNLCKVRTPGVNACRWGNDIDVHCG